jgi:multimeric flavodoxin WrbA
MNIVVLNGSPKGPLSGTLQYVNYLAKANPQHQFEVVNAAQQIHSIEKNPERFSEIIHQIQKADAVLWSFPLYFMVVHSGLKRFIELVFENNQQKAFEGKYCAAISTSIHFFDHTAHNYIHAVSDDLKMHYVAAFSPAMNDLTSKMGQQQLLQFGTNFLHTIEVHPPIQPLYPTLQPRRFNYTSGATKIQLNSKDKKVLILHDALPDEQNTLQMVAHAQACFSSPVEVINLREINIKGGCQGCMQCGGSYHCAYEGKDDFIEFYKNKVMAADILIYAAAIHDRYLSSRWKTLFDRSFFNTHTPVLQNKQMMWMISGPFQQIPNIKQIFQVYSEFQKTNLVGVISDEQGNSTDIDGYIEEHLSRALVFAEEHVSQPDTFLGVGGMKVFRDEIWGSLRVIFPADHKAFRKLGFYKTFPQRSFINFILRFFAYPLLEIPFFRKQFNIQMKEQMIVPLQQVVERATFN